MKMTMKTYVAISVLIAGVVMVCSARRLHPRSKSQEVVREEQLNWKDPRILEEMFRLADGNKDGYVNITEHMDFFLNTPGELLMSPYQLLSMFLAADEDNNKQVTIEELNLFRERDWMPQDKH